ncbi:hypothetical protein [Methylobacterium bullatum]|uniref:Uncharacterized protein n=1 Tax=Methylobacterium bullatum TaxID=570505 RepID=A0A679KHW2_9HYPH|nr:hypothetical protein MBLL_03592 [Methylobacterium bullatum]
MPTNIVLIAALSMAAFGGLDHGESKYGLDNGLEGEKILVNFGFRPNRRQRINNFGRINSLISRIYLTNLYGVPSSSSFAEFCSSAEMKNVYLTSKNMAEAYEKSKSIRGEGRTCSPTRMDLRDDEVSYFVHKSVSPQIIVDKLKRIENSKEELESLKIHDPASVGSSVSISSDLYNLIELRLPGSAAYEVMARHLSKISYKGVRESSDGFNELIFQIKA